MLKDGLVYDAFTTYKGLSIASYKALWDYADIINVGFQDNMIMALPPLLEAFRLRPGMFLVRPTLDCAMAFLDGYDAACQGGLLTGFREWLVVRADDGNNLVWSGLVHLLLSQEPQLDADQQIARLFELLVEYVAVRSELDGFRRIYATYEAWLRRQSWYKPGWPGWWTVEPRKKK